MRKVSLRAKVAGGLGAFTFAFVLTLVLAIGFGFEPIYYSIQKHNMVTAAKNISKIYSAKGAIGFTEIDDIISSFGADVFIVDQGILAYSSRPNQAIVLDDPAGPDYRAETLQGRRAVATVRANVPQHIRGVVSLLKGYEPSAEDLDKVMYYADSGGEHIRFFSLVSRISDHTYVTISQPLAPLQENVKIVQRFIVVFGCVWMALALWGALKASQRLTEPLYELKEIAMDMAQLNFSRKWSRTGMSDEINMVGESLNTLSDKLNTALEALQQSNTALQEQLDKANEIEYMRKSFISAVSHELKTPLAIIQGYAEALENLQNVSAETREYYCFVIRSETRKMDGLVKDILNLSRLEAGRLHLELTNFDFVALIEETKIRFQAPAEEKKIRIVWNMLAEMPAYGDPRRYDIILNNFLSNAVDYTPVNGTIRITAKAEEDDYLIEVFNEGKQIPEEYHQRIWEPFYKVDSSHTRDAKRMFGGHGLGLGIVSSLLTLHGQKYGVRNEKDGVTLWFTVARAK